MIAQSMETSPSTTSSDPTPSQQELLELHTPDLLKQTSSIFTQTTSDSQKSKEQMPIPSNAVAEWLKSIGMPEYIAGFLDNGFDDLEVLQEDGLTEDDLDLIGVEKKGHRKKLQNKVKKLQE